LIGKIALNDNSIIDVHTHGMGIMLTHLLKGHYPYVQDIVDLSEKARANGVDYVVSFPMPSSIYYDVTNLRNRHYIKTGNCDYPFQYENEALLRTVCEFGLSNILPFVTFSTRSRIKEQKAELKRLIENYNVYGLKYHATIERRSVLSPAFEEFVEIAENYDLPILVHTKMDNWANPNFLISFAEKHPSVRICAAHCAHFDQVFFAALKEHSFGNLYVDSSPFIRICSDIANGTVGKMDYCYQNPDIAFHQLFDEIPTKLLWGSDAPFNRFMKDNTMYSYMDDRLIVKDDIRRDILRNTCSFLFGDNFNEFIK